MARSATVEADAEGTEEKQSRKRVDPATLGPDEKILLSFNVPAGMRVELKRLATEQNVSETQFVRNMIASQIGYAVPESFNERKGRVGKYSNLSEDERKAAIKAEQETKRQNVAKLLEAVGNGQISTEMLAALGIDPSALPKPRAAKDDD